MDDKKAQEAAPAEKAPLTAEELKAQSDQLKEIIEHARVEAKREVGIIKRRVVGSLVYGGPWVRKWKNCIAWVREDIVKNQGAEIKQEVFESTTPLGWAFFLHPERGWLKYDLREMLANMKRHTEVSLAEDNTAPASE